MTDKSTTAHIRLQNKIRETIPQSDSMQFSIETLDSHSILVSAPLSRNYNIHGTGFAGSIYSLGILTGWAMCYHTMELLEMSGDLVVGKAEIIYQSPITEDITCVTSFKKDQRETFQTDFINCGKSNIQLEIKIGDSANAVLKAQYFAIASKA